MSGPIPMLLWCPLCAERHIDVGEFATKPHHTHACQRCGMVWRPAVVPTTGVQFLPGFKSEESIAAAGHLRECNPDVCAAGCPDVLRRRELACAESDREHARQAEVRTVALETRVRAIRQRHEDSNMMTNAELDELRTAGRDLSEARRARST